MAANLELLRETMEWIKAHPEQHNQGDWADTSEYEACGTSMCFAGHATLLAGGTFDKKIFEKVWEWNVNPDTGQHVELEEEYDEELGEYVMPYGAVHVSDFARDALGLTSDERNYLFGGRRTLDELEEFVTQYEQGYRLVWDQLWPDGPWDYKYVK